MFNLKQLFLKDVVKNFVLMPFASFPFDNDCMCEWDMCLEDN